jgi:signal transduction histidine kinase
MLSGVLVEVSKTSQRGETKLAYSSLAARLLQRREADVTQLKRELHDHLGQLLFAIGMDVKWLRNRCAETPPLVQERLQETARLVEEAVQATRGLYERFRPQALSWGSLGLEDALRGYVAELVQRYNQPIHFTSDLTRDEALQPENASHFYHIAQEALLNAVHHAAAMQISVQLRDTEEALIVSVVDDGKGFNLGRASDPQSFGLAEMRERTRLIGGKLDMRSMLGVGTTVTLSIPLRGYDD